MAFRSVSSMVANETCTFSISYEELVYCFGKASYGENGHEKSILSVPTLIPSLFSIKSVNCGRRHTVCLDYEGCVFTFGSNVSGQLGISEDLFYNTHLPQKVDLPSIKQVSCGLEFNICLSEIGELYSFGCNNQGQLGIGSFMPSCLPHKVKTLNNIEFFDCGANYTLCKTINGDVYCWGYNFNFVSNTEESLTAPLLCRNWPDNIVDIKCGYFHALVLTSDQEVYSCGKNGFGQLGRKTNNLDLLYLSRIESLHDIIRIECGKNHSICIDINNDLYVFGYNFYGQLGLGDTNTRYEPIKHPSLSNIIDISTGGDITIVKTLSNEKYAFGNNNYSQLGINGRQVKMSPVQIFKEDEDIWYSNINKSRAKSARK